MGKLLLNVDLVHWTGQNKCWKLSDAIQPWGYKRWNLSVSNKSNFKSYPLTFLAINKHWKLSVSTEICWNKQRKLNINRDTGQRTRDTGQGTKDRGLGTRDTGQGDTGQGDMGQGDMGHRDRWHGIIDQQTLTLTPTGTLTLKGTRTVTGTQTLTGTWILTGTQTLTATRTLSGRHERWQGHWPWTWTWTTLTYNF